MAISIEYVELRATPRSAAQAPVTCVEIDLQGNGGAGESALMVDQSRSGAGLLVNRPFRIDQVVRLEGLVEGDARTARVRWVSHTRGQYRIGVEFDEPGR
jgi:hypothetical protein